jgi:hypothetical protein
MADDEIRWELGERIVRDGQFVPGLFVFFYAGVIGWKWIARAVRRRWAALRKPARLLQLPPPLKALPPPDPQSRL